MDPTDEHEEVPNEDNPQKARGGKRNRKQRRAPKEEDNTRSSEPPVQDKRPRKGLSIVSLIFVFLLGMAFVPIGERVKIAMSINDGNEKGIESSNNGPLPFNNTGTLDPVDLDEAPLASFYSIASRVQLRKSRGKSQGSKSESKDQTGQAEPNVDDMVKLHKKKLSQQMRADQMAKIASALPKNSPLNNKQPKAQKKHV